MTHRITRSALPSAGAASDHAPVPERITRSTAAVLLAAVAPLWPLLTRLWSALANFVAGLRMEWRLAMALAHHFSRPSVGGDVEGWHRAGQDQDAVMSVVSVVVSVIIGLIIIGFIGGFNFLDQNTAAANATDNATQTGIDLLQLALILPLALIAGLALRFFRSM